MSIIEFRSSLLVLSIYDTTFEIQEKENLKTETMKTVRTNFNRNFSINPEAANQDFLKNLQYKYTLLASASLNTFKLLKQNEDLMEKQRSQIFINSASLYSTNIIKDTKHNLNNSDNQNVKPSIEEAIKLKIFDNVNQNFTSELFMTGVKIGTIEGIISIKNIPLLRQIMCGVHTEKGLDLNSAYLGLIDINISDKGENRLPEKLNELMKNSTKLFLKIAGNSTSLTKMSPEYRQNNDEINLILDKIVENLKHTEKESIQFYNYGNTMDIMKGQQTMIDLGVKILSVVDNLNNDHRLKALNILTLIMDRGEIDLELMSKIIHEELENFHEVCLNLLAYHTRLLDFSLTKLGRKSTDEATKTFIERCLAFCYFRIPSVNYI